MWIFYALPKSVPEAVYVYIMYDDSDEQWTMQSMYLF